MGYTPFLLIERRNTMDLSSFKPENVFWEKRIVNITTTAQTLVFNLDKDARLAMLRFITLFIVSGTVNNRVTIGVRIGDVDHVLKADADLDLYESIHDGDVMIVPRGGAVMSDVYNAGGAAIAHLTYAGIYYYE